MNVPLVFEGMSKRYGSATVLDNVSVELVPGRVHALMGENGAGKSTFIKLIAGVVQADSMSVRHGNEALSVASASDASSAGFRFIHQELNIVPQLSVAENILLGHSLPNRLGLFVNWKMMAQRAKAALKRLGINHIDPRTHAGDLGTGDRMLIKLASALVAEPDAPPPILYVLDEPTAALQEAEVENLFRVIRGLRDDGAAILYVSHRMEEITALCDDVTVLRNGKHISTRPVAETSQSQIVHDMTGRDLGAIVPPREVDIGDKVIARLDGVSTPKLSNISVDLRAGEIVGIAGLSGSGQTDYLRLFLGLEPVSAGQADLKGGPLPASPAEAWERGVAYVPQERRAEGLMVRMGVRANTVLPHLRGLAANRGMERSKTGEMAERVKLKFGGLEQSVWQLSGGNQQKVVFARALAGAPSLLLLDEPTRGVDIGAKLEIYSLIRDMSQKGCAVVLASSDLPEIIGLSDRVLILQEGSQTDIIASDGLTPGELLHRLYAHPTSQTG